MKTPAYLTHSSRGFFSHVRAAPSHHTPHASLASPSTSSARQPLCAPQRREPLVHRHPRPEFAVPVVPAPLPRAATTPLSEATSTASRPESDRGPTRNSQQQHYQHCQQQLPTTTPPYLPGGASSPERRCTHGVRPQCHVRRPNTDGHAAQTPRGTCSPGRSRWVCHVSATLPVSLRAVPRVHERTRR